MMTEFQQITCERCAVDDQMQLGETNFFFFLTIIVHFFCVWMVIHPQVSLDDCCLNVRQCVFLLSDFYTQRRCVLWCLHSDTLFL